MAPSLGLQLGPLLDRHVQVCHLVNDKRPRDLAGPFRRQGHRSVVAAQCSLQRLEIVNRRAVHPNGCRVGRLVGVRMDPQREAAVGGYRLAFSVR